MKPDLSSTAQRRPVSKTRVAVGAWSLARLLKAGAEVGAGCPSFGGQHMAVPLRKAAHRECGWRRSPSSKKRDSNAGRCWCRRRFTPCASAQGRSQAWRGLSVLRRPAHGLATTEWRHAENAGGVGASGQKAKFKCRPLPLASCRTDRPAQSRSTKVHCRRRRRRTRTRARAGAGAGHMGRVAGVGMLRHANTRHWCGWPSVA